MRPAFASHISDWDTSAHSRSRVGCDGCHGGNPTTFESFMAHRDVLPPSNPASPVHRSNIVTTCGRCHAGPFVAFQKSRHYQLLTGGNSNVPTCITCHEETGSRLLSPKALEGQCASCHGPGKEAARPEFPTRGRTMLEGIRDARTQLREANRLIDRVKDKTRRARLESMAQQVDVPLIEATQAGHAFVYDALEERLATARTRLAALFTELADPAAR
jgi:cytochrome c553